MRKKLRALGEFGLIEEIKKSVWLRKEVIRGPGDDCAVIRKDARTCSLFTCDMIVEDVDFKRSHGPSLIGHKAVSVCLSDIAACGGSPRFCLVSAGLPRSLCADFARRLCGAMIKACRRWDVSLVGGDISRADKLVIDVSMYGEVGRKNLVLRSGARQGDFICVTGPLGGAYKGRHLRFTPRLREAHKLIEAAKVHAMIDISDGLAQDLGHLIKASGVGAVIYQELIPRSPAARSLHDALYSGEDFELLFTVSARDAKRLLRKRVPYALPIGEVTDARSGLRLVDSRGKVRPLDTAGGFRHF